MIDPLTKVVATLRAQMDAEKAQAQRGSRFADEARWTATNAAIEQMLIEHFATIEEPDSERLHILHAILLEHDERRPWEAINDLFDRGYPVADDEVITACRAYITAANDAAAARAMVYDIVLLERAMHGIDGECTDTELTWQIGEQLNIAADLLDERRASAKRN